MQSIQDLTYLIGLFHAEFERMPLYGKAEPI